MSARITVDLRSAIPPYEQIRSQISSLIAVGSLQPEERLPTVRGLATDLGVAAGTVARAYKELEAHGLIESRRRHGTIVAPSAAGTAPDTRAPNHPQDVMAAIEELVLSGRRAGVSDETLLGLLRGRLGVD